jgi:hypothetical protein
VAQIEFARDVIFQRRARLHDLFQRAVDIGVALGGATQTRHIFGRHINRRYHGKLETVLERRDEGFPVLRSYYKSSYVKQYEKGMASTSIENSWRGQKRVTTVAGVGSIAIPFTLVICVSRRRSCLSINYLAP